jgi:DNA-binding NtrC family response regulator
MGRSTTVITVGADPHQRLSNLLATLKASGFRLVETASPEDLSPPLDRFPDPVIVVYNPPKQDTARRVLQAVSGHNRRVPVIVIVDQSDLDEYYQLMCEGAFDYFELSGDPRWVERSVRCATHLIAA